MKRPKVWAVVTWLASLAAGLSALLLGDRGAPAWVFALLFLWLLTAGLPTLLAALLVGSAWGTVIQVRSLGAVLATIAIASLIFQLAAFELVSRSRSSISRWAIRRRSRTEPVP